MASTLQAATVWLGRTLGLLEGFLAGTHGPEQLLRLLGWSLPPGVTDVGLATADVSRLVAGLEELDAALTADPADELRIAAAIAEAVAAFAETVEALRAVAGGFDATPDYLARTRIAEEFLPRLLDLVVIQSLFALSGSAFSVGQLLGVVAFEPHEEDPANFQVEHHRQVVYWDRLPRLVSDPEGVMGEVYGWGTADFDVEKLLLNVVNLLGHVGVSGSVRPLPRRVEEQLSGRPVPAAESDPAVQLFVSLVEGIGFDPVDVGLSLFPLRPTTPGGADGGVGLSPFAVATQEVEFPLADRVSLLLETSLDLEGGVAVLFRPDRDPELHVDLNAPAATVADSGDRLLATVRYREPPGERRVLLAAADGVGLDVAGFSLGAGISGALDPILSAAIEGGRLVVAPGERDGFLAAILPAEGVRVEFDLALEWSRAGLAFRGGAGLSTEIALDRSLGPVRIRALHLAVAATGAEVDLEASVSASTAVGPVTLSIERLGLRGRVGFSPGNLGPVDFDLDFKPPTGVGLGIDAVGLAGGGFLDFDPETQRYAGVLQLELDRIALTAVGLLATRLPDGSPGFSLLVFITAQDFTPIQVGLGFRLTAVGGLLAIHRTVAQEVLRTGLEEKSLDAVLFPPDPLRDAAQLLSRLRSVFPPSRNQHVFGPVARFEWGVPTLLRIELGILLELPAPSRLVALGQLRAAIPSRDQPLIRLNMDALGVVDFDRGLVSLDATLYDSRIAGLAVSGDMALRSRWKDRPTLLLAVGGFHPRFGAPPGFPALQRLTVAIADRKNARLTLQAYLALTSNTAQIGARLDLLLKAATFSVEGVLAFDALFEFSPFRFEAAIVAAVALKWRGRTLFGVSLELTLSGPSPWHAVGKATFKVWIFKKSVSFDRTFGKKEAPRRVAPAAVLPELLRALADPRSWDARIPGGGRGLVTVREIPGEAAVPAHPSSSLSVSQRVVPLHVEITRFGRTRPADGSRFAIEEVLLDGVRQELEPVRDFFAPAQFIELTESEKLARPSFESLESGVRFASRGLEYGGRAPDEADHKLAAPIAYDTKILEAAGARPPAGEPHRIPAGSLAAFASLGAVADAAVRRGGREKFRGPRTTLRVPRRRFVVAGRRDLAVREDVAGAGASFAEAAEGLRRHLAAHPEERGRLQVVALHETAVER